MCFKIFNSSNRQEFVINEDTPSQFMELDQKVNSLVKQRQNTFIFPNCRFGKSIKRSRVQRMKVGEALIKDGSIDTSTLKKVKKVFNKTLFQQLKGNKEELKNKTIHNLRLFPNLETTSLTSMEEFYSKNKTLSQFSKVYKTAHIRNADLEFIIQLGDSIFKVKGMEMENGELNGTGAFGRVFLGINIVTGDKVAIKVASPPPDEDIEETIIREGNTLLQVYGLPNTVGCSCIAIDRDNELMFAVMDQIDGAQELFGLHVKATLDNTGKIKILSQGATALEAIHDNDIIHRDIKLENFLIDRDGNAYLIDFGFARNSNDRITTTEGTPDYLAPEVLRQQQQTKKTDSFSYGIMMYELFVGKAPDYNQDTVTMYKKRVKRNGLTTEELTELKTKSIPQNIIDIIDRCLKQDQDERPDMTEIKNALLNQTPHQIVTEKTENFYEQVGNFFQRNFQGLKQENS